VEGAGWCWYSSIELRRVSYFDTERCRPQGVPIGMPFLKICWRRGNARRVDSKYNIPKVTLWVQAKENSLLNKEMTFVFITLPKMEVL